MKNPFSTDSVPEQKLVRNLFDLGRSSVFTTEFGQLYPFFLQEVIPGDTAKINASIGFRGMPTLFPLQTKIRCSMEFYYVRNRTLFDGWEDFIYKTKDIEAPWLKLNNTRAKQMVSTGSLGDALGVPTSYASDSPLFDSLSVNTTPVFLYPQNSSITQHRAYDLDDIKELFVGNQVVVYNHVDVTAKRRTCLFYGYSTSQFDKKLNSSHLKAYNITSTFSFDLSTNSVFLFLIDEDDKVLQAVNSSFIVSRVDTNKFDLDIDITDDLIAFIDGYFSISDNPKKLHFCWFTQNDTAVGDYYLLEDDAPNFTYRSLASCVIPESVLFQYASSGVVDATLDGVILNNPFVGDNPDVKLSALPFRAYEQVMNYYYRNDKNNPYVLNGEVQYNEFIPTHEAGADENVYDFHYRNWELDRFTSAVPSPQFGEAPLVGLTYNIKEGTATLNLQGSTLTNAAGETIATDPSITVGVDSDGKIESIVDFTQDVPSANLRRLQEMMQSHTGISINDLRITNSFQRFLENTLAKGLRYRNQMRSHHHVSVDYPDIDVPQYIGGASGIIDTGQINNMSETGSVGLGDYIGTLEGGIQMKHDITHYCVEHGFIIGICSVSPIPSYPQSINKTLIKNHPFDYYLPEFGKIGYVPIHYSELMPLQTPEDGSVDDIFGYQKAWYDYMQAFDEVHGDFRISLKDFVLTRTFAERPELSESFTVVDPEQLNDVFLANNIATEYNSTARWLCRSNVSCIMKRQIPMIGTPSLE